MKNLKPPLIAWALSVGAAFATPQGFALHDTPQPVANVRYEKDDGSRGDMEDFRGKVILANVWCRVAHNWALPQSVWRRGSILALNSSGPARPYMARLRVFRRLI